MNKLLLSIIYLLYSIPAIPNPDRTNSTRIIAFTPTQINTVNGLAIGLWNKPEYRKHKVNGLNLEIIGYGWITPFLGLDDGGYLEKSKENQVINGLSFGLTLFNGKVNGVSVSPLINTTYQINGLKFGLINVDLFEANGLQLGLVNVNELNRGFTMGIYNHSNDFHGVQFGLINRTQKLRGIQIGLININKSRTMILFNWRSK